MEPRKSGTGNVAADQSSCGQPLRHKYRGNHGDPGQEPRLDHNREAGNGLVQSTWHARPAADRPQQVRRSLGAAPCPACVAWLRPSCVAWLRPSCVAWFRPSCVAWLRPIWIRPMQYPFELGKSGAQLLRSPNRAPCPGRAVPAARAAAARAAAAEVSPLLCICPASILPRSTLPVRWRPLHAAGL
jgi:hypothetical protein